MSRKSTKLSKNKVTSIGARNKWNLLKYDENTLLEAVIGTANVKWWLTIKASFSCDTNESFTKRLLQLAQDYLNRAPCKDKSEDEKGPRKGHRDPTRTRRKKSETKKKNKAEPPISEPEPLKEPKKPSPEPKLHSPDPKPSPPNKLVNSLILEQVLAKPEPPPKDAQPPPPEPDDKIIKKKRPIPDEKPLISKKEKPPEPRKKFDHDIRKAPELQVQNDNKLEVPNKILEEPPVINNSNNNNNSNNRVAIKIKLCHNCNTRHTQDHCPLNYPNFIIPDALTLSEWHEKFPEYQETERDNESRNDETDSDTFCRVSIPEFLCLSETGGGHGLGVWARDEIQEFTQFGPLIGKVVKEVDISEDSSMRDLWEIGTENGNVYFSTENFEASNWMRFVRPASSRDDKNLTVLVKERQLFFVTVKTIRAGDELVYWHDSAVTNNKKKMEKTTCGGCNMTFAHPLYYRTHCSVFHDVRYSLTIRKYHCKVCGAAVLGKENIMKHAAELHNGQGAYQCQFCKKFFLRLNYLEMHRTYGCSANPHRSRPLCDFCGRKFCQPQKLKVHIKRMHSDFAEVLKEFQCKNCLKILGSRAALQRHLKEVHQKQMDGACSCSRCGKHFQNKSNLKIHMLTHSGIKPFKCVVKGCSAAFTTKQCLQFHYKKVHNLTEEGMPKIERSVDYTFEAYSGVEDGDDKPETSGNAQALSTVDSDIDDNSVSSKTLDDPPASPSPLPEPEEQSPESSRTATIDSYNMSTVTMKILTKGSKKWIGDQPMPTLKSEVYQLDHRITNKEDAPPNNNLPIPDFSRHEASNASLLVEAALDSVCSEPNIDIDVGSTPNCTDALVNNLYTLAPPDTLPDVSYNESRDINLISPSVNDHISVTDELNDELRHNQNIGMDYSSFHQEDFSPGNSPEMHHRNNFVRNYINNLSPPQNDNYNQPNKSPVNPVPSPPRYDFGHAVNTDHLSSDDSNGMAAQNLSLHSKHDIQLDLSIYKSPYKLEANSFHVRRIKFDEDFDKGRYNVGLEAPSSKSYVDGGDNLDNDVEAMNHNDLSNHIQVVDLKGKDSDDTNRNKYPDDLSTDIRSKFDIDLDLRIKNYDVDDNLRPTTRTIYESAAAAAAADLDFRKNYDLIDNIESRNTGPIEPEFRDRNFEPLVLNSELQGLDMSARSFHNYPNINRYHHLYPDVDRVDLRLNYSPPAPSYTHADILRVVSLDLTPPGRHSVDLSLRGHPLHQIANSRLLSDHAMQTNHRLLDQSRLLSSDLSTARHLSGLGETTGRILSDHTTNRILATNNDQLGGNHLLGGDQRLMGDEPRLLEQSRIIGDGRILPPATPSGAVSPVPAFSGYATQNPYHPTPLTARPPTPAPFHHYSTYY